MPDDGQNRPFIAVGAAGIRSLQARRFPMNFPCKLLICGFLWCLLAAGVQAQEAEQGEAVFCDTQVQIEQFAAYSEIDPISEALEEVNHAAPHACEPLIATFVRGEQVKAVRIKHGTLHLYEVLIVGVWRGQWGKVDPTIQYIAVFDKEEDA
jgi:hypothetical protein